MLTAMIIWNVWHPGRYLLGEDSDFPKKVKVSRKEKARMKREAKELKRQDPNPPSDAPMIDYHLTKDIDEGGMEEGTTKGWRMWGRK